MSAGLSRLGFGLLRRVRARVPHALFEVDGFVVFRMPPLSPSVVPGISGVELGGDDLARMAACRAMHDVEEGARAFSRRLALGARAFGLIEADALLGYCWGRAGAFVAEDRDRYRMDLGPADAYLFDAWVHPAARGRRLFDLLVATTQRGLATQGARHFVTTVALDNAVSLRVHERAGARRVETVGYLCVAGLKLHVSRSALGTRMQVGDRDFVSSVPRGPEAP